QPEVVDPQRLPFGGAHGADVVGQFCQHARDFDFHPFLSASRDTERDMMVRRTPREWTVLVYNAGTASAGMNCTHNLLDMERVGSDEYTQVVCMNGRSPWVPEQAGLWRDYTGARTYALGPGTGQPAPRTELGQAWSFLKTSPAAVRSPLLEQGN